VAPLYGSVDPRIHRPVSTDPRCAGALGHLGTYAADREEALRVRFVEPARRLSQDRFLLAGSMYGSGFPWLPNIHYLSHLPPADHPAFYCSTRLTSNVTRQSMAENRYCPSGSLFEATACGAAVISDFWEGIEKFFEPGSEILLANNTEDVLAALDRSPESLARIGRAGRARTLSEHTAAARSAELERILESACNRSGESAAIEVV
jgi:spore maturation protein CgeB